MFARSFAEARLGRVRLDDWLLEDQFRYPDLSRGEVGGCHHMGTTRMADDPTTGVVDRDCKVFDVANLYVAGSSVFSTTGHGNPTFTIVQLAQRLADHLNATLGHWPYAHCGVRCD
jgi:choline dehydrogenase-like flavoprotein